MRIPPFLKAGNTIGLIAPSFGINSEPRITLSNNAIQKFKDLGYKVLEGPNCRQACGVGKSNSAIECAREINSFFTSDKVDVLVSCAGGETMCEDLEFVDFNAIAQAKPKWFMGYSDNTNLIFTLPTLADTCAIYGPNLSHFGQTIWHPSLEDAFKILTGKTKKITNYPKWEAQEGSFDSYNCTEVFSSEVYVGSVNTKSAEFSGTLLGGCLDCLGILCGTKFDKVKEFNKTHKSVVWFMEACDLGVLGIKRTLWQLKMAGWFDNAGGFLIGRPLRFNDLYSSLDRYSAVLEVLSSFNVPIVFDLDIGHLPPMMTLVSGAEADIKAKNNYFELTYKY